MSNVSAMIGARNFFDIMKCGQILGTKKNRTQAEEMAYLGYKRLLKFAWVLVSIILLLCIIGVLLFCVPMFKFDKHSGPNVHQSRGHVYETEDGELRIWYIRNIKYDVLAEDVGLTKTDIEDGDIVSMYVEVNGDVIEAIKPAETERDYRISYLGLGILLFTIIMVCIVIIIHRLTLSPKEKAWYRYYAWYRAQTLCGIFNVQLSDWNDE